MNAVRNFVHTVCARLLLRFVHNFQFSRHKTAKQNITTTYIYQATLTFVSTNDRVFGKISGLFRTEQ